jgi:5-methylcytosine-specific restriction endonuclease McrA
MAAMRRWETTYAKSEARCDSVKRIEKCIRKQPHECFWCGKKLSNTGWTIDHVTPLSKGGDNTAYNMVKCCKSCNCSKHDKMPDDWVRSRKTPLRGVLFQRYCNDRKVSA